MWTHGIVYIKFVYFILCKFYLKNKRTIGRNSPFKKKDFINLFLEVGEWREKGRERNINMKKKHQLIASSTRPDWGLNTQHMHYPTKDRTGDILLWNNAQPVEPYKSGQKWSFCWMLCVSITYLKLVASAMKRITPAWCWQKNGKDQSSW